MITRPRWSALSVAALAVALVVAVCGIAPAPGAAATERGCQTGKVVESVSGKVQATVEAPAVLSCHGQAVPHSTAIGLLPPSADAEVPASPLSEEVSSRAPPSVSNVAPLDRPLR